MKIYIVMCVGGLFANHVVAAVIPHVKIVHAQKQKDFLMNLKISQKEIKGALK